MSNFVFEKENPEFLAVLEAVALEKGLKKDVVNKAIEVAFETALIEYFKGLYDVSVKIKSNGAVFAFKKLQVVENVLDSYKEIELEEAKNYDANAKLGIIILAPLSVSGFSSNAIRNIGRSINQGMTTEEKQSEFNYFLDQKDCIISGTVKKINYSGLLIGIDKYEAFLPKSQMLPTEFERIRQGERLDALVFELERSDIKPQALLTRSSEVFLFELLKQAIPEILDESIQIKSITRDAGSRAKVAVFSKDPTVNAVLLCVSTYGRKIRSISKELGGERIDIIEWNEDPAIFIMNALRSGAGENLNPRKEKEGERERSYAKPINVLNITVDYENKSLDVIVAEEDISFAIGRKGQNVRLLSKLIGWPIHFITKDESSQKKFEEITARANLLTTELNIDEMVSQLLVLEKLDTVEKIADAELEKIASIEGFDEEIAESIKERASMALQEKERQHLEKLAETTKQAEKLAKETGIKVDIAIEFIKVGITNKTELSELSIDEVVEDYKLTTLDQETISQSIMKARGF